MDCPYCGRKVAEGKTFCECGRPVSLSAAAAGSSPAPKSDFQQMLDQQTLSSVKGKKQVPILPIVIIVAACIAIGVVFLMKFISEGNIVKEDTWEVIDEPKYSIKLPTAMSDKTEKMLTVQGDSYEKIAFYTCSKAAVYITGRGLHDAEKEMYGGASTSEIMKLYEPITRKVNDVVVVPQQREKYVFYEMAMHRANYISDTDEVWEIQSIRFTDDHLYEVSAYCPESEKDKYRESMLKWLDSFEPK